MTGENLNTTRAEIDRQLEAAIEPWLAHMRWRPDFEKWRKGRIWQEAKQERTLANLRLFMREAGLSDDLTGLKILDLGCGMGGLSTALALAGAKVQPYDYNPAYCKITKLRGSRYNLGFNPVNGVGEALPFPKQYFDLIVCMDVLEHVQQPDKLLSEIGRCVKPGGLVYITAINRFAFNDPHYHVKLVNWLPRRMAPTYLSLSRRAKDNSRFTDRQTLAEMHYYRFGELPRFFYRHGFTNMRELGELELAERHYTGLKKVLQQAGLLKPVYLVYRYIYKGTYQLMVIKNK